LHGTLLLFAAFDRATIRMSALKAEFSIVF